MLAEVHDEVAGLLRGPGSVGMCGYAQHVQAAVADLEHEQHVEPPHRDRAVDVEDVDREHAGGLGAQELPPAGVGMPDRRRWDAVALKDPTDRRGADAVAECEQLAPSWTEFVQARAHAILACDLFHLDTATLRGCTCSSSSSMRPAACTSSVSPRIPPALG
jgi:hypothetical protein